MANLIILSVLLGAVLGRFFKILVLLPACAFIFVAVVVKSAALENGLLRTLLEFALLNVALQIGYVCSLLSFSVPNAKHQRKPAHAPRLLRH